MGPNKAEGVCPTCGEPLGISTSNANRGQYKRCDKCYRKAYVRAYYAKNRKQILAHNAGYYRANWKKIRETVRDYWYGLPKEERNRRHRTNAFKRKYGITIPEYDAMVVAQKGLCFLCSQAPPKKQPLAVDHCHKTRTVRKLLCKQCNFFLGIIERDPAWVERALKYLKT